MTLHNPAEGEITDWSAAEIARRIQHREVSAREVCQAHIDRCQAVNPKLNALVWTRYEEALREAAAIDDRLARGETVGPLAGVPVTVKECFFFEGSPTCVGLAALKDEFVDHYGHLVEDLRESGAILLGKTNVPQLMLWFECDNPVYGRTSNPWSLEHTPGGSTGGEAAIIAAHGSPLGLGTDLGGSIRVPSAWCGISGLKPTSERLTNQGMLNNFGWLNEITATPGPMARSVEDLDLAMRTLVAQALQNTLDGPDEPWKDFRAVDLRNLRVGVCRDDNNIAPSPAISRALHEAVAVLRDQGAEIHEVKFPPGANILQTYSSIVQSDGGEALRRLAAGSKLDWRVDRILTIGNLGPFSRAAVVLALRLFGQPQLAHLIASGGKRTGELMKVAIAARNQMAQSIRQTMENHQIAAILCPPIAVPAPQHGKPIDLLPTASYAFLANLLGWPAGVVPVTTVRENEQNSRPKSRDIVLKQAAAVDAGSVGLPVGVQVLAPPWREDVVLAVMAVIERGCPRPKLPADRLAALAKDG
jgi:fatty acid amide hydrolase